MNTGAMVRRHWGFPFFWFSWAPLGLILALCSMAAAESPVWVDFTYTGTATGTQAEPYKTLAAGLDGVSLGGVLILQGGDGCSSAETPRITKAARLTVTGGVTRIGADVVDVPVVVGMTQQDAETALVQAGLDVGTVTQAYSDTVPAGEVISQNPPTGYHLPPGTVVNLVVSIGPPPPPVTVPNVQGLTQAEAEIALTDAGLAVGTVTEANHAFVLAGRIIGQTPMDGARVSPGTAVDLVVSRGPVVYVDKATPASAPNQDGATWATAYADLQPAIDAAFDAGGGDVWVAAGVYDEPRESYPHGNEGNVDWDTASVIMRSGVNLYGGFTGSEIVRSERDWDVNETVIDGSWALLGIAPARHVVVGCDDATLDGFTVTGGEARGGGERDYGGGMYNDSSSPTVTNCVFESNSAAYYGGGMFNRSSLPEVTNCVFSSNSSNRYGGGMWNGNSSSMVTNCVFESNSAGDRGGGMYNSDSSPTVTNCVFSANSSNRYGGGMYNGNSSPMVTNCVFESNSTGDRGGGMYNYASSPGVSDCVFSANSSDGYGGGMYNQYGLPVVTNCIFESNSAGDRGGGMYNYTSSPWVTDCVFSANSSNSYGGGMYISSSSPVVTNCTLYANTATDSGGAVWIGGNSNLYLRNSIIWGVGSDIETESGSDTFVGYSDVQGGYPGTGNLDADPEFFDAANGDFRLMPNSPCIDTGTSTGAPEDDLRGVSRPQGAGIDMGAYEMLVGEVPD